MDHLDRFDNILIIKPGAIGDLLQLTPVVRALKSRYPRADISLLVGSPATAELFSYNTHILETIVFDKTGAHKPLRSLLALRRLLHGPRLARVRHPPDDRLADEERRDDDPQQRPGVGPFFGRVRDLRPDEEHDRGGDDQRGHGGVDPGADFAARHPEPAALRPALAALGAELEPELGELAALTAVVLGTGGPVRL